MDVPTKSNKSGMGADEELLDRTKLDDGPTFFGDGSLAGTPKPTLTSKGIRRVIKVVDENFLLVNASEN